MVEAWLRTADVDPADVRGVRLEQVVLTLDARTLERHETRRRVLVEVTP